MLNKRLLLPFPSILHSFLWLYPALARTELIEQKQSIESPQGSKLIASEETKYEEKEDKKPEVYINTKNGKTYKFTRDIDGRC